MESRPTGRAVLARKGSSRRCGPVAQRDEDGLSDVLGSILLISITVIMAGLLAGLLLAFEGPALRLQNDLVSTVDPGSDNTWGAGTGSAQEFVRIVHRGGDAIQAEHTTVVITVGTTATAYTGASQLGSAFQDGKLSIGETWTKSITIAQGQPVRIAVINREGGDSTLIGSNELVAAGTSGSSPCATDLAAPTVAGWTQSPAIISGTTTTAVTITAQLTDSCWGVNPNVAPHLYWRVTPAVPYTDQGAMTPAGFNLWTAVIPSQTWSTAVGQSLQYRIGPLTDLGANTAAVSTPDRSSTIVPNCAADNVPPTASSLTQSPADVRSTTVTAVTATLVATDDCAGVDQGTAPHLFYRINDGTSPAYTDGGAMSLTATSTWQGSVPARVWALDLGKTLEWYVTGFIDLNGNLGTTAVQSDVIDGAYTYTYVNSNTPTAGTVTNFANAQSAADSGLEATVAEAGTATSPTTILLNGNSVASSLGWSTATSVFASDNTYASYNTASPTSLNDLKVELQNPGTTLGTITQVVLHAELSITSHNNDGFQVYACFTGTVTCNALSATGGQSASDTNLDYDLTSLRPGGGSWSWADINDLQGVVRMVQSGTRDGTWRVDHISLLVTSVSTTYTGNVQFSWTGVGAGASQTLDLRYRVTGDTFNVQVCQDALLTCGTWATRGTTLSSTSATSWSYILTTAEYNLGAPRIRFVDTQPTGTTQGNLFIDYARVGTL